MPFRFLARRRAAAAITQMPMTAGSLARAVPTVGMPDALGKAITQMRAAGVPALPVVENGILVGWVTEDALAALVAGRPEAADDRTVQDVMVAPPFVLAPFLPLPELAGLTRDVPYALLPVATPQGVYLGCVVRADVLAALSGRFATPRIGGMATPLGVYLTTGRVSGGAGWQGLVLTGVLMALGLWLVQAVIALGLAGAWHLYPHPLLSAMAKEASPAFFALAPDAPEAAFINEQTWPVVDIVKSLVFLGGFLVALRFMPWLGGYHAAEHQTVNAIEAGEPLTPAAVARQSRVHPRCGTNLVALMTMAYLGIAVSLLASATYGMDAGVLVALFCTAVTVLNWRRVGGMLQQYFTTRPASPREIASGIKAGEEVLARHRTLPPAPMTLWQRLWYMGLAQVLTGAMLTTALLDQLNRLLDGWWHSLVQ